MKNVVWVVLFMMAAPIFGFSQKELKKEFNYVRYFDHATKQWSELKPGNNQFVFVNEPISEFDIIYQSGKVEHFKVTSTLFQHEDDGGEPFVLASIEDERGKEGIIHAYRNDFGYIKSISITFNDYWLSIQFLNK